MGGQGTHPWDDGCSGVCLELIRTELLLCRLSCPAVVGDPVTAVVKICICVYNVQSRGGRTVEVPWTFRFAGSRCTWSVVKPPRMLLPSSSSGGGSSGSTGSNNGNGSSSTTASRSGGNGMSPAVPPSIPPLPHADDTDDDDLVPRVRRTKWSLDDPADGSHATTGPLSPPTPEPQCVVPPSMMPSLLALSAVSGDTRSRSGPSILSRSGRSRSNSDHTRSPPRIHRAVDALFGRRAVLGTVDDDDGGDGVAIVRVASPRVAARRHAHSCATLSPLGGLVLTASALVAAPPPVRPSQPCAVEEPVAACDAVGAACTTPSDVAPEVAGAPPATTLDADSAAPCIAHCAVPVIPSPALVLAGCVSDSDGGAESDDTMATPSVTPAAVVTGDVDSGVGDEPVIVDAAMVVIDDGSADAAALTACINVDDDAGDAVIAAWASLSQAHHSACTDDDDSMGCTADHVAASSDGGDGSGAAVLVPCPGPSVARPRGWRWFAAGDSPTRASAVAAWYSSVRGCAALLTPLDGPVGDGATSSDGCDNAGCVAVPRSLGSAPPSVVVVERDEPHTWPGDGVVASAPPPCLRDAVPVVHVDGSAGCCDGDATAAPTAANASGSGGSGPCAAEPLPSPSSPPPSPNGASVPLLRTPPSAPVSDAVRRVDSATFRGVDGASDDGDDDCCDDDSDVHCGGQSSPPTPLTVALSPGDAPPSESPSVIRGVSARPTDGLVRGNSRKRGCADVDCAGECFPRCLGDCWRRRTRPFSLSQ